MRQINLLPPEIQRRRLARRQATILGAGVLAVVLLMLLIFAVQAGRLSSANGSLARQQRTNDRLQGQVDQLAQFADLQQSLANERQLLGALTQNEVRWSTILADIATIIPQDVWLTQFNGTVQVTAPTASTATTQAATTYGAVSFGGCALEDPQGGPHVEVARWLDKLGVPREFINAYLTLSAVGSASCPVSFNSSVNLDADALRRSQRGGTRAP